MINQSYPCKQDRHRRQILVWALVIFTVGYRVFAAQFPELSNSTPTMALCFGGGLLLGRSFWWVPAVLVIISDYLLGLANGGVGGIGSYTILTAVLFCGAAWAGSQVSRWSGKTWPVLWTGVMASSILFYIAANTYAWAVFPGYEKSLFGWMQSNTSGLPGYPPSWLFLRNALIGDSAWCLIAGLLFFVQGRSTQASPEPAAH